MLDQQLSVSLRIRFPQLSHLDPPILAALMVSNTTHESLWDITHRICDRYLGALRGKNQSPVGVANLRRPRIHN